MIRNKFGNQLRRLEEACTENRKWIERNPAAVKTVSFSFGKHCWNLKVKVFIRTNYTRTKKQTGHLPDRQAWQHHLDK